MTRKRIAHSTVARFGEFWTHYRRSRLGMIGLGLVGLFSALALGAPLITPYDPIRSTNLAGSRAAPIWMTLFLSHRQSSRNIAPIADPSFSTADLFKQWNISSPSSVGKVLYAANMGREQDGKTGSILFQISKPSGAGFKEAIQQASIAFVSNYEAPERFTLDLYWNVEISGNATARISAIIQDPRGNQFEIWEKDLQATSGEWLKPSPRVDSWSPQLRLKLTQDILGSAEQKIFSTQGTYQLILKIKTQGNDLGSIDVKLYLDDVEFRCYGAVFGLLGTDQFGADLFSQLIYGARISLAIGVLASLLSVVTGTVLGIASGYVGGTVDQVMMRFNDMLLVLPSLPLLLVLIAVLGPTIWNLVILIGLLRFMSIARVIRSQVLSYKERTFIEAAKAAGAGPLNVMFKQLLPNVMSLAFAQLALSVPAAIVSEASLSWLGLGDPTVSTWGRMLYLAHYYGVLKEWWWIVFPGLCIALISIAFIFVGHAMDEILNPRLRPR